MWCVLSGGNFHGEYLSRNIHILFKEMGDMIRICNAKIGITVERQTTYMLNPSRNKILPIYLIANSNDIGLMSGFMIPHYTLNSLVQ
jgi:histidine ammonia-lyase